MPRPPRAETAAVDGERVPRPIGPRAQANLEAAIADRLPDADAAPFELFLYLSGTAKMFDAILAKITRPHGIDNTQFTMLFALWCADPPHLRSPTDLHRMLVLSPGGVSHTIRRLESGGLVTRVADDQDGRAKGVQLSRKGKNVVRRCAVELHDSLAGALRPFTNKELSTLVRTQRELTAVIARSPDSYPQSARRRDAAVEEQFE